MYPSFMNESHDKETLERIVQEWTHKIQKINLYMKHKEPLQVQRSLHDLLEGLSQMMYSRIMDEEEIDWDIGSLIQDDDSDDEKYTPCFEGTLIGKRIDEEKTRENIEKAKKSYDIVENAKLLWENKGTVFAGFGKGMTKEVVIRIVEIISKIFIAPMTPKQYASFAGLTMGIIYRVIRLIIQSGTSVTSWLSLIAAVPQWIIFFIKFWFLDVALIGGRFVYQLFSLLIGTPFIKISRAFLGSKLARKLISEEKIQKFFLYIGVVKAFNTLIRKGKIPVRNKEDLEKLGKRGGGFYGARNLVKRLLSRKKKEENTM
jgi:hypothetical protein